MNKINLVFVDDHKIMLQGLISLLQHETKLHIAGAFRSANEYINSGLLGQTDVLLLDMNLPGESGLEFTKRLQTSSPQLGIIILTALNDSSLIEACVKAGSRGFLTKDASKEEIVEAIQRVHQGEHYFGQSISHIAFEGFANSVQQDQTHKQLLSPREIEVLQLLAEGKLQKQIAAALSLSIKTVESHKANIQKKLKVNSTADLIKYAIREGFVLL